MRALTVHREVMDRLISDHGGRIANTAGDSVVPIRLPWTPSSAQSRCRSKSQQPSLQQPILFRIGLHVGDVMVHGGDLLGDGVNITARLQALAEPGGICISAAAHEYVRKAMPLSFADLGPQRLKNVEEAVRVYALKTGREWTGSGKAPPPSCPPRHCCSAVHQHEWRSRAGVLCRWLDRGRDYRTFLLALVSRHRAELHLLLQGQAKSVTEIGQELAAFPTSSRAVYAGRVRGYALRSSWLQPAPAIRYGLTLRT